jgi:ankyrin repeat protein
MTRLFEVPRTLMCAIRMDGRPCTSRQRSGHLTTSQPLPKRVQMSRRVARMDGPPLHDAAERGRPANIATLAIAGARVDARDEEWRTPLHDAAEFGPPANIAMLISAVANVNARDKHGLTPLHLAAWKGTPDNIAALLDGGASGITRNSDGKTPFDLARRNDKIKGTAAYRALNDAQENVSLDGQSGRPPEASSIESNNDR